MGENCKCDWATFPDNCDRYGVSGFCECGFQKRCNICRFATAKNLNFFVCQSFAKNMGLNGEGVGTLSIVTNCEEEAQCVKSQMEVFLLLILLLFNNHASK